ncbi:hypothetical protein BDV39DRAFT_166825 [Aspergillus sergii]|uniref:Uncharacterized protein n=1 Tax=Aspergillus sergii TaxID=1034303 RepID=A0A5N6XHX8_9EURO|nr:hypothetical protein BDV39DRAFT_166825 [Aspergillus sergii]
MFNWVFCAYGMSIIVSGDFSNILCCGVVWLAIYVWAASMKSCSTIQSLEFLEI